MKLSLRKANAVQLLINEALKENFNLTTTITQFDNPTEKVVDGLKELNEAINKRVALIDVLFSIRAKVGVANSTSGIDSLLNELAKTETISVVAKGLASVKEFLPSNEQIVAKLAYIKKVDEQATPSAYSTPRASAFNVSLVTKESTENFRKESVTLRKTKQKLQDKLLHLNVSTEIELSPEEVATLEKYEIL